MNCFYSRTTAGALYLARYTGQYECNEKRCYWDCLEYSMHQMRQRATQHTLHCRITYSVSSTGAGAGADTTTSTPTSSFGVKTVRPAFFLLADPLADPGRTKISLCTHSFALGPPVSNSTHIPECDAKTTVPTPRSRCGQNGANTTLSPWLKPSLLTVASLDAAFSTF